MEQAFWLTMEDGTDIFTRMWMPEYPLEPRGVVQIAHGMVEHIGRYGDFANFLVSQNFIVYGHDHRGHGKTGMRQGQLGHFANEYGFNKTSDDVYTITCTIKDDHPDLPVFLFGHSMGSFLVRHFIQDHSTLIDGVILSGTGFHTQTASRFAKELSLMLPANRESKLLNQLVFGSYNRKIPGHSSSFDWLSRDHNAVQAFIDDPLTGAVPTARFFHDLMTGLALIHDHKRNQTIRKDLPLLIMSGDADPVGHYETGVWKTAEFYTNSGLSNVITMLFEGARHELLQEINHVEVYHAILDWLDRQLNELNRTEHSTHQP